MKQDQMEDRAEQLRADMKRRRDEARQAKIKKDYGPPGTPEELYAAGYRYPAEHFVTADPQDQSPEAEAERAAMRERIARIVAQEKADKIEELLAMGPGPNP